MINTYKKALIISISLLGLSGAINCMLLSKYHITKKQYDILLLSMNRKQLIETMYNRLIRKTGGNLK